MSKLHEHQMKLELLFSKNQLLPRLRKEFLECEEFDFCAYMTSKNIDNKLGIELLCQMSLHKRCDLDTLVGCLRHLCKSAQDVVDQIQLCAEADLVNYNVQLGMFIVIFEIDAETQAELDRFQYPLPMVVKPKYVKNNKQSGYMVNNSSLILKNNHHDDDINLDHINRINRIPLKLNMETATMIKNSWRNLDKPKTGETKQDYKKRVKAFNKYDASAKDVMEILTQESDVFYLPHKYDKRGRTYCQGYHVSYQGAAWNKAVIEFANEEVTTK